MITSSQEQARQALRSGGVICFPTETVYGLGANPSNHKAVDALLHCKGRAFEAGVPLIIDLVSRVEAWIAPEDPVVRKNREELLREFWPGPLTIVIATNPFAQKRFHPGLFGPGKSLALRLSSQSLARELANALDGAITATSANPRSAAPAENAQEAEQYFPELLVLQHEGDSTQTNFTPSTLIDVRQEDFKILREGAISRDALSHWLKLRM